MWFATEWAASADAIRVGLRKYLTSECNRADFGPRLVPPHPYLGRQAFGAERPLPQRPWARPRDAFAAARGQPPEPAPARPDIYSQDELRRRFAAVEPSGRRAAQLDALSSERCYFCCTGRGSAPQTGGGRSI